MVFANKAILINEPDTCIYLCTYVWIYVCMCVYLYVCTYVYMCVCVCVNDVNDWKCYKAFLSIPTAPLYFSIAACSTMFTVRVVVDTSNNNIKNTVSTEVLGYCL